MYYYSDYIIFVYLPNTFCLLHSERNVGDISSANIHCLQVTSFIREESRENMQIIIISLKEEFFSKADALLGVYSDVT